MVSTNYVWQPARDGLRPHCTTLLISCCAWNVGQGSAAVALYKAAQYGMWQGVHELQAGFRGRVEGRWQVFAASLERTEVQERRFLDEAERGANRLREQGNGGNGVSVGNLS